MNLIHEKEKRRRMIFILSIILSALLIFIYNILTPMMTDDLFYAKEVAGASSLWDLVLQERRQYMTWSGRSVSHLLLRIFLRGDKMIFNVANTLVFVLLTLCMYWNVEHRRKHDTWLYLLINLLLWIFGVVFRQTVLWETGAFNYLWGSAIILGFVTLYRYGLRHAGSLKHPLLWAAGLFPFGVLAGWCNENTSGGGILMVLLCLGFWLYENKAGEHGETGRMEKRGNGFSSTVSVVPSASTLSSGSLAATGRRCGLSLWMITGLAGQLVGFLFMVLAPGNALRAQTKEEEHSGLFAYVSRFQKITLAVRENFLLLLIIGLILFIIIYYQRESWKAVWEYSRNGILWAFVFLATCYALVLTPEPMPRAYFGAGIFLMIAAAQFWTDVGGKERIFSVIRTGMVCVMLLVMFFTYMDCGAHLARICREYHEREVYLTQKAQEGVKDVTIPMLRPDFENKYSDGYNSDIQEDPGYWVNVAYASYYGFDSVSGVPREGWTEY